MADEQIIYLSPEEELTSVRERLEQVKARHIILVVPPKTHLRSHVGWRVLHARMRELGKEVLVISSDRQIRALAKAVGFRVADSVESRSPSVPPGRSATGEKRIQRPRSASPEKSTIKSHTPLQHQQPVQGTHDEQLAQQLPRQVPMHPAKASDHPSLGHDKSGGREGIDMRSASFDVRDKSAFYGAKGEESASISPRVPEHNDKEFPDLFIDHYNQAQFIRQRFQTQEPTAKHPANAADMGDYPTPPLISSSGMDDRSTPPLAPARGASTLRQGDEDVYGHYLEDSHLVSLPEQRGSVPVEDIDTGIPDLSDIPTHILEGKFEDLGDEGDILLQPEDMLPSQNELMLEEPDSPFSLGRIYGSRQNGSHSENIGSSKPVTELDDEDMLLPTTARKGQQFGHYRLIQQLRDESIGEVYLGEHIEIGTRAVIKILYSNIDLEEFQNDVRHIARLIHPNIVRLLDFGVKDHKPFLIIDYSPKGSIVHFHSKLYSGHEPLLLPIIVNYTKQLANALQYMHDQNLQLGNLHPENMLVGDNDEILLSNLDIAFMDRTKKASIFIGNYTAPEQASGKCLPASDQYALGAIVYEWLCGSPPFSFNSSADFHEKMEQLTNTSPPLLRTRVSTVPSDVEEVIMKALTRDPKQRFASIEAFANALEQASLPGMAPNVQKRVGQQFGNYRLTSLIGEGGFADVYLGKHINLNTQVAVKVLHTRLTTEDVEHFRTEARTIASLRHPNIIRVLDFGVNDNVPFLVMDYASSGTLRDRHPKGSILPLARILPYIKQIASALQYAHDQRLIHRDIKPDNILLGHNNEILLSDFGIAIVSQSSLDQRKSHYDVAGTVTYMAPEQIQGHPHRNSDQYALGIIIYEWLCGVRPFNGSYLEIAIQHERALPEPLRNRVPSISPAIEKVVLTALAKDPKQRFASIQAFANALEQASQQKF